MAGNHQQSGLDTHLPLIGLVLSCVIGPLGLIAGIWCAARDRRLGRDVRLLAIAAIVVGLVQTVVVAGLLVNRATGAAAQDAGSTPSVSRTYPSWSDPTETAGAESPTPVRALPTSLESYVPATVGPYAAASTTTDQTALDAGATSANNASYSSAKDTVDTVSAEWATAEEAEAYVKAQAAAEFGTQAARVTSELPSGYMWYFMKDGTGYLYAYQGRFTIIVTGEQEAVQEFFSQFPA